MLDLVQNAPYVLAAAGVTLITSGALVTTGNLVASFLLRVVPIVLGGVCLWTSALILAGA